MERHHVVSLISFYGFFMACYLSILATSTLIILFSDFKKNIIFKRIKFSEGEKRIFYNISEYFILDLKSFKLINYSTNMCWSCQGVSVGHKFQSNIYFSYFSPKNSTNFFCNALKIYLFIYLFLETFSLLKEFCSFSMPYKKFKNCPPMHIIHFYYTKLEIGIKPSKVWSKFKESHLKSHLELDDT
jgi:hypothetical protein